ncbi:MAG: HAD-IC family P-type ATPase [Actinomycetota bacterium]
MSDKDGSAKPLTILREMGREYPRTGLSAAEVRERIERGHTNRVRERSSRSLAHIIRANVFNRFNALLGTLAVVVLVLDSPRDALFGLVLVFNTLIGIFQEWKAKRTLDRLYILTAPRARVVREGSLLEISREEVVLDDLLEVGPGDQLPVDGLVVSSQGLEVDESLLTGESFPVPKEPGDRVWSGSFVSSGRGRFRATAVGEEAYAQKLAFQARRFSMASSELREATNALLRYITWIMVPVALLFVSSQVLSDVSFKEAVIASVAGLVGMVPEGLVLLTSIVFAVSAVNLARRNVLVQELPAVEGLARVDVLCMDKTGTLTEGVLDLREASFFQDRAEVEEALGEMIRSLPDRNATLSTLLEAFPGGAEWEAVAVVPFSSARKWSAVEFQDRGTWVLGAPEILLEAGIAAPGGDPQDLLAEVERSATQGHRVLMLAKTDVHLSADASLPTGLRAMALLSLGERVRPDASQTLAYFQEQGVKIKVISGDNPHTVASLAARVEIPGADAPVDARSLPTDVEELAGIMDERSVFGRVVPEQKRDIVRALRERSHVVAMTGDGVNDTLALKEADLGIAMGSGAASTKAVAQLILLDGRFSSLPGVVALGRRVMANMERVANLFLTKTVYVALLAIVISLARWPFPLLPRHITLVGSLTIGIPAFILSFTPSRRRYRPGLLRRVIFFSFPAGIIATSATFMAVAMAHSNRVPDGEVRTTAVIVLACVGLAVLAHLSRPLYTWKGGFTAVMGGAFAGTLLLPWFRHFFQLFIPSVPVLLQALGIAAIHVLLLELAVRFAERRSRKAPLSGAGD